MPVREENSPEMQNQPVQPRGPESRGQELAQALKLAQGENRSTINQSGSASAYARLVEIYDQERTRSHFTNEISGVLVSGMSIGVPRIDNKDGKVVVQDSETYTAKWLLKNPDALLNESAALGGSPDPANRGKALVLAVDAPLALAIQRANPEISPTVVKNNETNRTTKEFVALNAVAPLGDPATGRPTLAQAWLESENGGQMPVYGFRKREAGGGQSYMGVLPGLDADGGRTLSLVSKVDVTPGVTDFGTRNIQRTPTITQTFPIETPEQQQAFLAKMEDSGWRPVTKAPPENSDLPREFRGLSEVDVSSRAVLLIAEAATRHNVIMRGLEGNVSGLERLPVEQGLVNAYSKLANAMGTIGKLQPTAVKTLFNQMNQTMVKLGELRDTVDSRRMDPACMDPITEFRIVATNLLKASGKSSADASALFPMFDRPEEHFAAKVGDAKVASYSAADNIRKAILEQLAKDVSIELGAFNPSAEPWKDGDRVITFPDGTPRVPTPFDQALSRGGAHYDAVREKYYALVQASINTAANYVSVRLMMTRGVAGADGKPIALDPKSASRMAQAYVNEQLDPSKAMEPQERALVDTILKHAGPATQYLDELMRTHTFAALVAAHRDRLTPAEFSRAMEANARDWEPWSVAVKSYHVGSFGSNPQPSGPTRYIAPEQALPENFDPTDAEQVRELAKTRTWRIMTTELDDGRAFPVIEKSKLSTQEMMAERLALSFKHNNVVTSRREMPENAALGQALAKTFNMPVVEGADVIDGTRGRFAVQGVRVTGSPIASSVTPGYYKAINYGKAKVYGAVEPVQLKDEHDFADKFGVDRAISAVHDIMPEGPQKEAVKAALADMGSVRRERGVYEIRMDQNGIKAFEDKRNAAIDAMVAGRIALAEKDFRTRFSGGLSPDRKADLETQKSEAVRSAQQFGAAKHRETVELADKLRSFIKENFGKTGFIGFAPSLGVGNTAVRMNKPPFEFRFHNESDIEAAKPRLNKHGLNLELEQFSVES